MLEPVSVSLKFGFLAVLYLFLFWVVRSALNDLREYSTPAALLTDTGMYGVTKTGLDPRLRVERAPGLSAAIEYELRGSITLGRSEEAGIQLQDFYASTEHVRIEDQGGVMVIEDLGSTNGTLLNGEQLYGPQPLHPGDRITIGESEFTYLQ